MPKYAEKYLSGQLSLYFTSDYWIKMGCKQHFTFICLPILDFRSKKKAPKVPISNVLIYHVQGVSDIVCKITVINIYQWNNLQDMGTIFAHCFHAVFFCEKYTVYLFNSSSQCQDICWVLPPINWLFSILQKLKNAFRLALFNTIAWFDKEMLARLSVWGKYINEDSN